MAVKLDLVTDASISYTEQGTVVQRTALVSGVNTSKDRWIVDAINTSGVPRWGDPHPVVAGVKALDITARPVGQDKAQVDITYRVPAEGSSFFFGNVSSPRPDISVGATIADEITQVDKDKKALKVKITITDTDANGIETRREEEQIAQTEVPRPQLILVLKRRETSSPAFRAREYVGTVNIGTFHGGPSRTWLCLSIEGDSPDGGDTYDVTYQFQFNEATWDKNLIFLDPETGAPHEQVDFQSGNGVKKFRVLRELSFSPLRL